MVMSRKRFELAAKAPITDRLIFIDGISRSGKKLTCKVVSHLERVEFFQYASIIENTIYQYAVGCLDPVTAARSLRVNLDEVIYNRMIGRNLNNRASDQTCILRDSESAVYMARSDAPDGAAAVEQFDAERRISLFHTHSVLAYSDVLFEAFPGLKFVHVTRHPVDIAEDWLRRGRREHSPETDPLHFGIAIETESGVVPWYAAAWAEQYVEMSLAERCAEGVIRYQENDRQALNMLDQSCRDRIFRFSFEHLITAPESVLEPMAAFVGTEPHEGMTTLLAGENCPGEIPIGRRRENLETLRSQSSADVIERLVAASRIYETEWGLNAV